MKVGATCLFIAFLTLDVLVCAYDQSLEACKAVAAEFRTTCAHGDNDIPADSVSSMSSETIECPNNQRCIDAGTVDGTTCTWERKLCVTCFELAGVTKIRIQTNNLPDHCVSPSNTLPKAKNFDFEVNFNMKQTQGVFENDFLTQTALNQAVCRIAKSYNKVSLGIEEYGDDESRNAAGVAINGVVFQFANQIEEDPAAPITETNEQPLDMCLGHNQRNSASGMYHYHHLTPCLNSTFLIDKTASECIANDACSNDKSVWSRSGYARWRHKKVIGLAKFGHVMYGPYKDAENLWATDEVDACNGAWADDDYFYVGTRWHPYLVGCEGPSNHPEGMFPQCSTNGPDKYAGEPEPVPEPTPESGLRRRSWLLPFSLCILWLG